MTKHYDLASLTTLPSLAAAPRDQIVGVLQQAAQQLNSLLETALEAGVSVAAEVQTGAIYPVDSDAALRPTMHLLLSAR